MIVEQPKKTCRNCKHAECGYKNRRLIAKCTKSGKRVSTAMAACSLWDSLTSPQLTLQGEPT